MPFFPRLSLAALLFAATAANAGNDVPDRPLPQGWQPVQAPALHGSFVQTGHKDIAMLVQSGPAYGVAVIPDEASGRKPSIVRTFGSSAANPPQLSLLPPGSYASACHDGGACTPVDITTEAIGLCHGEASCEIIYFKDNAFHNLTATD